MSGLVPLVWAFKVAPVKDSIEKLVLQVLADSGDEDGCNCYPSQDTIAERAMISGRSVRDRLGELEQRGLIQRGDQRAAAHIPADKRPVVWDVMIPYTAFGDGINSVNAYRKGKGRPPLTVENRPALPPAPAPKKRADAGKKRSKTAEERPESETGRNTTPPGMEVPPEFDAPAAGIQRRERPEYNADNLPPTHLPQDLPLRDPADKSTGDEQTMLVVVGATGGASSTRATGTGESETKARDSQAREITEGWFRYYETKFSPIPGSSRVFHSLRTQIADALKAEYTPDEIKIALAHTNGPGKTPEACPSKQQFTRALVAVRTHHQPASVASVHRMDPGSSDVQRRANAW
jgi:hypothetical protein